MSSDNTASALLDRAPVRRVVTGHTPDGKAVVVDDSPVEPHAFDPSPSLFTDLFWTDTFPPDNDVDFKDLAKEHSQDLISPNGSSFRVVEIPPGTGSPFHRTVSLDYGILIQGSITLLLDDDKRVVLKPGDVVVQRGTIHGWLNEGNEWARMYFIMFPSQKVKINDRELETEFRE
ncbi:hypothetical protein EW145_g730 [Phellinidium pouzarii]|uniref:Cupin type-2 domain-containing protein n=1 Tax=Phellinidium pouzarii TaxID=167371 RepID=A0A4S4LMQ8_9AGAM|nr:hypothetical protein EW145_g730 [Phellinidium pouzarii]